MTLCKCGCGQEVKEGRRYIRGHHFKGKKHSEEARERMSESQKGNQNSKGKHYNKGRKFSEEHKKKISKTLEGHSISNKTKEKISKSLEGKKSYRFKHGRSSILHAHHKYKKQECLFGCKKAKQYDLHHEPPVEDILEWEGRLVNVCKSCHRRTHTGSLKLPKNSGFVWTRKDTEKLLNIVGV